MEDLFQFSKISLSVLESALQLSGTGPVDASWIHTLEQSTARRTAYFDERLLSYITVRVPFEPPNERGLAPGPLLVFLTHLQISLDASYISPMQQEEETPYTAATTFGTRLLGPPPTGRGKEITPRSSSFKFQTAPLFPPHTPTPIPQMAEKESRYAESEGVPLLSCIWGDTNLETRKEEFALGYCTSSNEWVAVYSIAVPIVFLRTRSPDPLLALTVSATLRDHRLAKTNPRASIYKLLDGRDEIAIFSPVEGSGAHSILNGDRPVYDDGMAPIPEVNLLAGLATSDGLRLPSSRLAPSIRRQAYSLPPVRQQQLATQPSPSTTARAVIPTLRKSFRTTLATVSGFKVRIRTIFVPYVPPTSDASDNTNQAGTEEESVVLCVEIENSGEADAGFAIEDVLVNISGEGATARLISWGESQREGKQQDIFPLQLTSVEQCNLLYLVSFVHPPDASDSILSKKGGQSKALPSQNNSDTQRAVAIIIKGRPYEGSDAKVYPTATFLSKWNCVLDVSPHRQQEIQGYQLEQPLTAQDALPTPASPFPTATPRTQLEFEQAHPISSLQTPSVAGSKRHTFSGLMPMSSVTLGTSNYRASTGTFPKMQLSPSVDTAKFTPTLPSIAIQTSLSGGSGSRPHSPLAPPFSPLSNPYLNAPMTPAFPAYPSDSQPKIHSPNYQMSMSAFSSSGAGPMVEPHRERRLSHIGTGLPPTTPGPHAFGASFSNKMMRLEPYADPVVVSVALLYPVRNLEEEEDERIYPLDVFALEIFVFNQSPITRRFEVGFPDRKRARQEQSTIAAAIAHAYATGEDTRAKMLVGPAVSRLGTMSGIMPLENRIRVGPLKPDTCQSVRMQFMALQPGLHSIDALTITDTEAEFTLNLRSVMDVVVHEHDDLT